MPLEALLEPFLRHTLVIVLHVVVKALEVALAALERDGMGGPTT